MGGLAPGQLKSRRGWHSSPRRLHYRFSFFDRVSRTHCGKNSINFAGMAHSHRHRLAAAWPSLVRQIGPVLRRRRHPASPSAIAGVPGSNPNIGVRRYFTYADDLRFIKGKHSWSLGGWYQRSQQDQSGVALGSAANVAYPSLLAFLQDRPTQAIVVRNAATLGYRTTEGAWYVQDDIKLRSNFNLRLGLRHEMTNGWNEVAGRCTNYFYDANFVIETNPRIGHSCLDQNHAKLLLQPRVGLAWDPTGP